MKKLISLLVAFLVVSTSLTGCSSNTDEPVVDNETTQTSYDVEKSADVIIVGAGGAGLAAAVSAVDNGAESVIIIEKDTRTGGNLNLTSGSMSAAETSLQKEAGIEDSKESFVNDIMKNGAELGNREMVEAFADRNTEVFEWLLDHGMADNTFSTDPATGGKAVFAPEHQLYSVQRTYKPKVDNPEVYKSAAHEVLDQYIKTLSNVTIDFETEATKLLPNEKGQVLSVEAVDKDGKTVKYTANHGVVMATGGYSGNFKMMAKYTEQGGNYLSSTTSMGEGIRMMQEVGAYVDEKTMPYIPTFPMGVQTGPGMGTIGSTYTWKAGGICVNQDGKRFVNEQESRVDVREVALEEQPGAVQYDIFTDKIVADLSAAGGDMMYQLYFGENGRAKHLVQSAATLEELAEKIGVPAENLVATVEDYNAAVDGTKEDEFGRSFDATPSAYSVAVNKIEGDKFYAIPLKALCVMTLGGVSTDTSTHVVDAEGNVIPGLYAAGEVVGGIWGKFVSGGTGVMGPITFGFIAGENAMKDTLSEGYEVKPAANLFDASLFEKEAVSTDRFDMSKTLADGEYSASVDGQEGKLEVKVVVTDGKIANVEIVEQHETAGVADGALESLPKAIVEENSVNLDVVSGATLTSERIFSAVAECLNSAAK